MDRDKSRTGAKYRNGTSHFIQWALTLRMLALIARAELPPIGEPFEVLVSEPRTVHSAASGAGTTILKLADGAIVNQYFEGGAMFALVSQDMGKSWTRAAWPGDSRCIGVLRDGTIIALGYINNVRKSGPGQFVYPRWVSRDHWKSWEGPLDTPVHIPKGTGGTADDLKSTFGGPLFWRSMIELPEGRILATLYGYFEGDNVPIAMDHPNMKGPVPGFNKYRTLLAESKDRGASWSFVSTIAYDPNLGQEGPCEPALARLRDGRLLCIMRTGYTHHPMVTSYSRDLGRTWSKPVSTGLTGVDPQLIVLSNGLVACAYGVKEYDGNRRERRIMFSGDGGKTWSHNTVVYAGYGGSYPDALEMEPGKLLYVYDVNGFPEPGQTAPPRNYLRMVTVTVRPVIGGRGILPFPIAR
ncbi:MAG: glycoside hydrolase [Acidobacteria bacterium]|nr:glycoside hydrolase [Acidobacteriota bacterium]MCI0723533.1 glycoside hydrolase [Acidobacteriota bacterium]